MIERASSSDRAFLVMDGRGQLPGQFGVVLVLGAAAGFGLVQARQLIHQHRSHSLVSHVRGPVAPVTLGGFAVTSAIPVSVAEGGNVTVHFGVLSYAGALTMMAITDPDHFPHLGLLTAALRAELNQIIQSAALP